MPPQLLFDISGMNLDRDLFNQDAIRELNPQRGDMEHLNGIVYADGPAGRILGYKNVRAEEFWVPGHIPGRPLLPGVLMIECGAQLASFYTKKFLNWEGFVGFGGVEDCKFRLPVAPGSRMYVLGQKLWERHHRVGCKIQGLVDGGLAFEATIVGAQL
jgi:3-hydroxyacyl-[acyl-carrier-protein] dehydratase